MNADHRSGGALLERVRAGSPGDREEPVREADAPVRRRFTVRMIGAFVAALAIVGITQYTLEARSIRTRVLVDQRGFHASEAAHLAKHLTEDGLSQAGLTKIADGLKHIGLRPGVDEVVLVDERGRILAAGDASIVGQTRHGDEVAAALARREWSGIVSTPAGRRYVYAGPVRFGTRTLAFTIVTRASLLGQFLADLRRNLLINLLLGLLVGLPFFYLVAGRRLSTMYGSVEHAQRERKWLLDETVAAAEDERSRLAAELHDGPIQRLASIGYGLERVRVRIERGEDEAALAATLSLQDALGAEIAGLRRIMSELRPPALDEAGIEAAVTDLVHAFEARTGVLCVMRIELPERMDPSVETVLYRLVQEGLTNVDKHAMASSVRIDLAQSDGMLDLEIADDGVGFDPAAVGGSPGGAHVGLAVMRERVRVLGGRWIVDSRPGGGTRLAASVPFAALARSA